MKNLAAVFNKPVRKLGAKRKNDWPLPGQMIGIELEAENRDDSRFPNPDNLAYWKAIEDHSLLNGLEFVLTQPLRGDDLLGALDELFQKPTKFNRYMTGSTHIHLDMTEEGSTAETVKSIVLMMYCLESVIFKIVDPSREFCGYTNKLISAPEALIGAVLKTEEGNNFKYLKDLCADVYGIGKYYGLNIMSLHKYGSVEFRYFPTAITQAELESWIRLVMYIKKAADENSVTQLIDIFSNERKYVRFVQEYLAEWEGAFLNFLPFNLLKDRVNKAIATAESCTSAENRQFNPEAVLSSKVLNKFVKKTAEQPIEVYPYITVIRGKRAPNANSLPVTVLFNTSSNEMYTNLGPDQYGWTPANLNTGNHSTPTHWKRLAKTLEEIIKNPDTVTAEVHFIATNYYGTVLAKLDKARNNKMIFRPGGGRGQHTAFVAQVAQPKVRLDDEAEIDRIKETLREFDVQMAATNTVWDTIATRARRPDPAPTRPLRPRVRIDDNGNPQVDFVEGEF